MKNIGMKFYLFIAFFMALFSLFLLYRTYSVSNRNVRELVNQQAEMALQFDLAIRKYVAREIRPVMYRLVGEDEFIPETMSTSFVARSVFDEVRREFPEFILKFSSDNPRNPSNKAVKEEISVIEYFNEHPGEEDWSGEIHLGGRKYMARFRARRMEESCLLCHGEPENAPASLLARYGNTAGFHRPLGKVIALDTIAIPMSSMKKVLWEETGRNFLFLGMGLFFLFVSMFVAVRCLISNRLSRIAGHFKEASGQPSYLPVDPVAEEGNDEITELARAFNNLSEKLRGYHASLEEQVEETLQANEQLQTEVEERRRTEEALRMSEARFRGVFDSSALGITISDLEGRPLQSNSAYQKMLGYSEEELRNMTFADITYSEDVARNQRLYEELLSGKRDYFQAEKRYVHKNGTIVWGRLTVSLIRGEDDKPLFVIGLVEDIRERKLLEEERMKASKLESIGVLAGGIAHDFNNLLTAILGNISLAGQFADSLDERLAERLAKAEKAVLRARDLTGQLLTFSKGGKPMKQVLRIAKTVKDAAGFALRGSNVECRYQLSDELWPVEGDEGQLVQVFQNLVINADQAMAEGGTITISAGNVTIGEEDRLPLSPGRYVKISVTDEGCGIDWKDLGKIFDPYFSTKKTGSGLGLSIVHSIVKRHDGHVSIDSRKGRGTTVEVYLPVALDEPRPESKATEEIIRGSGRILVMDDEGLVRETAAAMLGGLGYSVESAADGREAIEKFQAAAEEGEPFDAVLMDITVPGGMGGKEAIGKLLDISPGVRAIVSSGYASDPIMSSFRKYGFRGAVPKPYRITDLSRVMHEVLSEGS